MNAAHNNTARMTAERPILLLTRPQADSEAFWNALPDTTRQRVELLINPVLSIRFTGPFPPISDVRGLIFTSANAVSAYRNLGGPPFDGPIFAVGDATADAARQFGFSVSVGGGNANRLVAFVKGAGLDGPLMHLRGEISVGDIAKRLTEAGIPTREAAIYVQDLLPLSADTREALSQDRVVIAPVFSPRTARHLSSESEGIKGMRFAAISDAAARNLPESAYVAEQPDRESMITLVSSMVEAPETLERLTR